MSCGPMRHIDESSCQVGLCADGIPLSCVGRALGLSEGFVPSALAPCAKKRVQTRD